jgi:N-terminal domain of unknown function (DUF4140)
MNNIDMNTLSVNPAHCIELDAVSDGKISSVSVYPAHAEVTRPFTIGLRAGVNQVIISGLPHALSPGSLRFACPLSLPEFRD